MLLEPEYREMKEGLEQEIVALELKISEVREDELEIEELLDFTSMLLLQRLPSGPAANLRAGSASSRLYSLRDWLTQTEFIEPPRRTLCSVC
jgi:hypothetical protein